MPAALTAITTLLIKGIAAIPGLGGAAVWLTANMGIANLGTTLVLSWLLRTDVDNPFTQSSTSPGRGSIQPWQYIYGTVRTAGTNTFVHVSGENNQYLNLIHILAAHQVEDIGQLYYNHEPIEIDGSGDAVGRFASNVHIDKKLGTPKQESLTDLIDITTPFRSGVTGLKLDGAYQYGVSTVNVTNPNEITIALTFKPSINRNSTLISMEDGWRIVWNDDFTISFIDASETEIKLGGRPTYDPLSWVASDSDMMTYESTLYVGISGGSITVFLGLWKAVVQFPFNAAFPFPFETEVISALTYNKGNSTGKIYVGSNIGRSGFFGGNISKVAIWNVDKKDDFYLVDIIDGIGIPSPLTGVTNNTSLSDWPLEPDYTDVEVAWKLDELSGDSIDNSVASGRNDLIIKGAWTSLHTLNSRAYVRQRLIWDRKLFDRGVPPAAYDIQGKLVPDFLNEQVVTSISGNVFTISGDHGLVDDDVVELYTRTGVLPDGSVAFVEYYVDKLTDSTFSLYDAPTSDTTRSLIVLSDTGTAPVIVIQRVWSANAARCVMDYLHDPHIGMRIGFEEFDETSLLAAIDVCDDDIPRTNAPDEKRYEANGILSSSKIPRENIQSLLSSMAGTLVWVGGKWFLYAGAFRSPTLTFDEDDFVSDLNIQSLIPRSDNFNAVKGVFVYPNSNWEPTDFPPVTSATFEAEDQGERVYGDINLPFTTSYSAAQRLAKIVLFRQREPLTVRTKMKLSAFQAQPGTVVKINNSRLGFVDKEFELISGSLILDTENGIVYDVVLRETNSGVYLWATEEEDIGFLNNSALPDVFQIVSPVITLTSGTADLFKRADGTIHARIKIAISGSDPYVNEGGTYEIQFKRLSISASIWENFGSIPGNSTEAFILDVEEGDAYDVRVRAKNSAGIVSEWASPVIDDTYNTTTGHVVVGKTELPSDVTVFKVYQKGEVVVFEWDPITDLDRDGYEFRYGRITADWDSAILITNETKGTQVTNAAIPPSPIVSADGTREAWRFFIKAIDTSDNYSTNAALFDLLVTPTFAANHSEGQAPTWLGIRTDMVRDPKTGFIHAEDQVDSDTDDYALFDNYIVTAPTTYSYETPEIDISYDDKVDVWADIWGYIPSGIGDFTPFIELDHRLAAESFDGFEIWTNGQVTGRFFKMRFTEESVDSVIVIEDFVPSILVVEHIEADVAIVVPVGGLVVTLGIAFNNIPTIVVTPPASPSGVQTVIMAITRTTFTVFFLSSAGVDIGGTGSYTATGR